MKHHGQLLTPRSDRGPLRTLFVTTSMPVGGAETLLVNLVREFDRDRVHPEVVCLKQMGVLGERLASEIPVHSGLLGHKFDVRVFSRLRKLMQVRRYDAVVTVGAGDKMFWGRLAAWSCGTPVIASALHSTGWPDVVTRANRLLTPITDAFIAVAESHGVFLCQQERFPQEKVFVIPNGVDTHRFCPSSSHRQAVRVELGIPGDAPTIGVVAALRPEKNLSIFVSAAKGFAARCSRAHFVIVGDGPERETLERQAAPLGARMHFLGSRQDVERLVPAMDVFTLTSRMEASPVSILEAMACGVPVVATQVGSISEIVLPGRTGLLVPVDDVPAVVEAWNTILAGVITIPVDSPADSNGSKPPDIRWSEASRQRVLERGSLRQMVDGYQQLLERTYDLKCSVKHASPRDGGQSMVKSARLDDKSAAIGPGIGNLSDTY